LLTQGARLDVTLPTAQLLLQLPELSEVRLSKWQLTADQANKIKKEIKDKGLNISFRTAPGERF